MGLSSKYRLNPVDWEVTEGEDHRPPAHRTKPDSGNISSEAGDWTGGLIEPIYYCIRSKFSIIHFADDSVQYLLKYVKHTLAWDKNKSHTS